MTYKVIVVLLPQESVRDEWGQVFSTVYPYRHTCTASLDDCLSLLRNGNASSFVKVVFPARPSQQAAISIISSSGYRWEELAISSPAFTFTHWPTEYKTVTQVFGNNPAYYNQFGLPGHEGVDIRAPHASKVFAVASGVVSDLNQSATGHNYGRFVRIKHSGGYETTYAHLDSIQSGLAVGTAVNGGQLIGMADNTGNSFGSHLHLTLKHDNAVPGGSHYIGYPYRIVDPMPFVVPFNPAMPPPLPAETIDTLPFIRGVHRVQFDLGYSAGTQTTQIWHLDANNWLYIKGENKEYERLGLRTWQGQEWIFRFEDTSESPTRFYAHYMSNGGAIGAPWFPRHAEIGKWYDTPKFVQHYLKSNCAKQESGNVTDRIRLMSAPKAKTYQGGATLPNVLTLEWQGGEQYDFAGGNVAFRDATRNFWFIGWLQGRPDKPYQKPGCVNVGW